MIKERILNVKKNIAKKLSVFLILTLFVTSLAAPYVSATPTTPTVVNGRILTTDKSGDTANWVEIAQYGEYSLIVRQSYINWYHNGHKNDPAWQYLIFGSSNNYTSSTLRTTINNWFNGRANGSSADNLSASARLREFTVSSNALTTLGTTCSNASLTNGYSIPTGNLVGKGDDIAFALSYGEAANFVSNTHFMRSTPISNMPSSALAQSNFTKLTMPPNAPSGRQYCLWLRSVGDIVGTAGAIEKSGRTFQCWINSPNVEPTLIYPAMWVHSDVFLTKYPITVNYYTDSIAPENKIAVVSLPPAVVGTPITDVNVFQYAPYGYVTPGAVSGDTVVMARENFVDVLYTRPVAPPPTQQYAVLYIANGGSGFMPPATVNAGANYTVLNSEFDRFAYVFFCWNTQPDGSGTYYVPHQLTTVNENLILYAQWLYLQ
jgi:hypothetical protein